MHLRKVKVLISWFFLMVLALGMADFSLHSLSHNHAEAHDSFHYDCERVSEVQFGASKIFNPEQECLRCGQFLVHASWAVADLVSVLSPDYKGVSVVNSHHQLISNKLISLFLRGPPRA